MGLFDWFRRNSPAPVQKFQMPRTGGIGRSRETATSDRSLLLGASAPIPRRAYHGLDIDKLDMTKYGSGQLLDILSDISGEVSAAVWNTLRLGAVNWRFEVRSPGGKRVLVRDNNRLEEFLEYQVNARYGGFPSVVRQLFYTTFLQGALCAELEVESDLTDVVDIHPVQPWTIGFERDAATKKLKMFQQTPTMSEAKALNDVLVWYVPLDPAVDDPYGRAPAGPVIWPLSFDLQFLRDLKQAIHISGWGRLDVKVVQEIARNNAPPDVLNDSKKYAEYINGIISDVEKVFTSLRSDDTFIHTDAVDIKSVDPSSRGTTTVTPLTRLLELRLTRALKQLPVLMGSDTGTETQGTVQYEIYTNGLQAIRDIVGFTLSRMCETILRIWGRNAEVTWYWDSIRTKDRLREAQAEQMEIINEVWKRDQGWQTNDEATEHITGKPKAVGEPLVVSRPGPVPEMPNSIPNQRAAVEPSPTDGLPGRPVEGNDIAQPATTNGARGN